MAATAEHFHNQLNVHSTHGTSRNIDNIPRPVKDIGGLYTADIQHFVRSLRSDDPQILGLNIGNRDCAAAIGIKIRGDGVAQLVILHAVGKQLLNAHGIRTAPAQVCRCLKGMHSGAQHKITRVEHDARKQRTYQSFLHINSVDLLSAARNGPPL